MQPSHPSPLLDRVRERILSGTPDQPVRQDALALELGVSKIPLREAMARLEQEGLLRSHANRGYFVAPMSAAEAEEIYALRLRLEPEAAASASARATAEEQDEARAWLRDLDAGSGAGALNRRFHLALIRPARRPVTFGILERLHFLSERYVREHLEPLGRDARAYAEHRALLDAWLARDGEKVAALMRAHLGQTLADLGRQFGGG